MITSLYEHVFEKFYWIVRGVESGFTDKSFTHYAHRPMEDETTILYGHRNEEEPPSELFESMGLNVTKNKENPQ